MKRTRQVPLALLLGALWGNAWSAGFGELVVRSRLGEPLAAEIAIRATPEELRSLSAKIASPDHFREVGVPYNATVQSLEAKLVRDGGRAKIVLSSRVPIREPFVDVLLDMNWAGGRLVREFAILLDPPEVAAPARPVPAAGRMLPAVPLAPSSAPARAGGDWPVQPGDTLYSIARQVAPQGTSPEQALVALWRANREAFIEGDINRLKIGAKLKIPSAEEIGRISPAEARSVLHGRVRAKTAPPAPSAREIAAPAPEEQADRGKAVSREAIGGSAAVAGEDRLQVGAAPVPAPAGGGQPAPSIPSPETAALQESLAASEAALGEANDRIARLEAEIGRLRKLVETQSAMMAKMQEQAQSMTKEEESSLLADAAPLLGGAMAVVAGLLGWFAYRRRKGQGDLPAPSPEPVRHHQQLSPATVAATTMDHSGPATEAGKALTSGQNIDTSSILGTDFTQVAFNALHADEGVDPVAEAEVYLAYGRDPQAEEILLDALKQFPKRPAIYLKLLEVYAKRADRKKFDQYLRTLGELTAETGPDWNMALAIGQRAWPGDERFASVVVTDTIHAGPDLQTAVAAVNGAEIGTGAGDSTPPARAAEPESVPEPEPVQDLVDLDFDLDKLTEQMGAEPAREKTPPPQEEELLEFNLELPDGEEGETASGKDEISGSAPAAAPAGTTDFPDLALAAPSSPSGTSSSGPAAPPPDDGLKGMIEEIDFDLAEIAPETEVPKSAETGASLPPAVEAATAEAQKVAEAGPPTEVMDIDLEQLAADGGAADHDTRLQLAQAYLEMGDTEGARELLEEVLRDGDEHHRAAATKLMSRIGGGQS